MPVKVKQRILESCTEKKTALDFNNPKIQRMDRCVADLFGMDDLPFSHAEDRLCTSNARSSASVFTETSQVLQRPHL